MALQTLILPEGIAVPDQNSLKMLIFVPDRLGSTRAVVDIAEHAVCEEDEYYAFGCRIPYGVGQFIENRWRFAGKEEQEALAGLPYIDFGARLYSPRLGRWLSPDPLAEKYYPLSPYGYCGSDPVNRVDPDGRDIVLSHWKSYGDGEGVYLPGVSDKLLEALEEFAKTTVGYEFLSQYAKKGDRIGSVVFYKSGAFSNNNIAFREYRENGNGIAGSAGFSINKARMVYDIQVNSSYGTTLDQVLTIGHELFIHTDQIDDVLNEAINKAKDKPSIQEFNELYRSFRDNSSDREKLDHMNARLGKVKGFNQLTNELKSKYGAPAINAIQKHNKGLY